MLLVGLTVITVSLLRNNVAARLNGIVGVVATVPDTFSGVPATGIRVRAKGGLKFLVDFIAAVPDKVAAGVVEVALNAMLKTVLLTTVTVPGFLGAGQPVRLRATIIGTSARNVRRFNIEVPLSEVKQS